MRLLLSFFLFTCVFFAPKADAQTISGEVLDADSRQNLKEVSIENIFTGLLVFCDSNGKFLMAAAKGQLLEFKKLGFKTVRVRIPDGFVPSFFKIILQRTPAEIAPYNLLAQHTWKADSTYFTQLYKQELDFPKLSALDAIQHPFTALSKQNQQIWAFQDDFDANQKQKFVDYTFNADLVQRITHLSGDSLNAYIRHYKPSYEQLRSMGEYALYGYIKRTVKRYRELANMPSRNSQ